MPALTADAISGLRASVAARWGSIDPLLPTPAAAEPHCGAELTVIGADGQPIAAGSCEHWVGQPGSLDLTWGAARRFQLRPLIAGADISGPLDLLLASWRAHLRTVPEAGEADTAAVVNWPSRDIAGVTALIGHGLVPLSVIAARPTAPARPADSTPPASARAEFAIRRAGPADIDEVTRLGHGTVRYDSHFGGVVDRSETAASLRQDFAAALATPQPWVWLAERGGTAIGMLSAESPQAAAWIAPMVGPQPVAYTALAFVQPAQRSAGVGTALIGQLHAAAEAVGCVATLLHYEQTNPLSVPFWNRQGYRPVWTSWEARPASFLR